jgi:peptidoglycan/LPS O-acetylase OafA/YrhL
LILSTSASNRLSHIQGLRGLAVGLVVLYHAGFFFNGGFIGVDVFFVISGFVIGASLNRELEQRGVIRWRSFFFRRVRRLVPALSVTLLGTLLLYWAFFGAADVALLTRPLVSGSFFISNFYFFLERGYIALDNDPLRNLWSLSVEEQFYLALPLVFIVAKMGSPSRARIKRRVLGLVTVVLAASLIANLVLVNYSLQFGIPQFLLPRRFAFFSPFTRAWEFLVGLLLAFVSFEKISKKISTITSLLSLGVLIFLAIWLDGWQPFPGWFAVPVVIASAALVALPTQHAVFRKVLTNQPITYLGDISYSFYLVHWPLLVILKQKFGAEDSVVVVTLVLSLLASVLIYHFVENPIRKMEWLNKRMLVLVFVAFVFVPIGLLQAVPRFATAEPIVDVTDSLSPSNVDLRRSQVSLGSKVCLDVHKVGLPENLFECIEGNDDRLPVVFLLGDSHALSASEGVIASARRNGFRVMTWSRSGCPFLVTSSVNRLCNGNRDFLLESIESEKPEAVIIVNGVNHYLEGLRSEEFVPRGLKTRINEVAASYGKTIEYLLRAKIPTALMFEIPNMDREDRKLSDFLLRDTIIRSIDRDISNYEKSYGLEVMRVNPAEVLCQSGICRARDTAGINLYKDGQHVNADGSLLISELFDKVFVELKKVK